MMKLAITTSTQIAAQTQDRWGDLRSDETLMDLIRAEVTARGSSTRSSVLLRLEQALGPEAEHAHTRLRELCEALEYEGDITASRGGYLHVTPLRAIRLDASSHRIASSLPSPRLRALLSGELMVQGVRRIHRSALDSVHNAEAAVRAAGGEVLSPEEWAGLDLVPMADAAWLRGLDERLQWEHETAGSLERDTSLEWQNLVLSEEGPRWSRKSDVSTQLWRARMSHGRWVWVWTAPGKAPSTSDFVSLTSDEASRTVFAVARVSNSPVFVPVSYTDSSVQLELSLWLPRAEHRYLVQRAEVLRTVGRTIWTLPGAIASEVSAVFVERLGVEFANPPAPTQSQSALDEPLPELAAIGPHLGRLGLSTYRDVLGIDMDALKNLPAIGRVKLKRFQELHAEARSRAGSIECKQPELAQLREPELTPWPNDDDDPLSLIGRVSGRLTSTIVSHRLCTVRNLREWAGSCDPKRVPNYGRNTHAELIRVLQALERSGRTPLPFEGVYPRNVAELAERYLAYVCRMDSSREKIYVHRLKMECTLDETAQPFGITRERVRQIIETVLARDRPTWGNTARGLLDALENSVADAGGVVWLKTALEMVHDAEPWQLSLAFQLAYGEEEPELRIDRALDVVTTFFRVGLSALRNELTASILRLERTTFSLDELTDLLAENIIYPIFDDVHFFASRWMGLQEQDGLWVRNRQRIAASYCVILEQRGGPMSADAIALAAVTETDPAPPGPGSVVAALQRMPEIYSHGHGTWIHEDFLPFSKPLLDEAVAHCLPLIRAAGGGTVNVHHLAARLPPELRDISAYPYVLRDGLLRTKQVRGWRAGLDVAWKETEVVRLPLAERIARILPTFAQPFELDPAVEELTDMLGCEPGTAFGQLMASPECMGAGRGLYYSKHAMFEDEESFLRARTDMWARISHHRILTAGQLPAFLPIPNARIEWTAGAMWAVLRTHPDAGFRHRARFLWNKSTTENFWLAFVSEVLGDVVVFSVEAMRARLNAVFGKNEDCWEGEAVFHLIQQARKEGVVGAVGRGWYMNTTVDFETAVAALSANETIRRLALGNQDFVRESPSRALLNSVRINLGSFAVNA
jgi:hypothetical protein